MLLLAPAYLIQKNIDMYYSMDKALPSYLTSMEGLTKLKDDFGMACTQFVIIDDSLPAISSLRWSISSKRLTALPRFWHITQ